MELGCQPTIQTIQYQRFSQQPDRLLWGSIHPSKAQQRPCSHPPLEYPRTQRISLSRCGTRCPRAVGRLQREPRPAPPPVSVQRLVPCPYPSTSIPSAVGSVASVSQPIRCISRTCPPTP